jgi:hypothetical protein
MGKAMTMSESSKVVDLTLLVATAVCAALALLFVALRVYGIVLTFWFEIVSWFVVAIVLGFSAIRFATLITLQES